MKIKVFTDSSELVINNWLAQHPKYEIKFTNASQSVASNTMTSKTLYVFYEENEEISLNS